MWNPLVRRNEKYLELPKNFDPKMFQTFCPKTMDQKFLMVLLGGRAEGTACADQGARNPHGTSKNLPTLLLERFKGEGDPHYGSRKLILSRLNKSMENNG